MKSFINLYHVSLKPERQLLTLTRIGLVALVFIGLMLTWRIGIEVKQHAVVAEQKRIDAAQAEQREYLMSLNSDLGRRQIDRSLTAQVQRLEREVEGRRALLQEFARRGEIQRVNYTPLLRELAEIHLNGLWLTRIQISPRGIELHGRTQDAALIPRWMAAFEQTETLSPFNFSIVELRRERNDALSFALVSRSSVSDPFAAFEPSGELEERDETDEASSGGEL